MKKTTLRKLFASAVLGLSVMCAGVCFGSVDAKAAVKSPVVKVKSQKIRVCSGTTLGIQGNVVKSVKGAAPIKKMSYKISGASDRVRVVKGCKANNRGVTEGKILFKKPGTYRLTVKATDVKGRSTKKAVTFVAGKNIIKYTKNVPQFSTATAGMKMNFRRGVSWDKKYVKGIKVDASDVNYNVVGDYTALYTITGRAGEVRVAKCPVKIIKAFDRFL